mmetsp:Transcript_79421/g.214803  ORF Transcript_79421/g.214803 Transcript_79421/m.214803 type:complete len:356 (-) Transcript_79421:147-1214(-)
MQTGTGGGSEIWTSVEGGKALVEHVRVHAHGLHVRAVEADPALRLLPSVEGHLDSGPRPATSELAHRREARDARGVRCVDPSLSLAAILDSLGLAVDIHVLQHHEQRLTLRVRGTVVVHEDRQDPDVGPAVAVAGGPVGDLDEVPVLLCDEAAAPGRQGLGLRVVEGLGLSGDEGLAGPHLRKGIPQGLVEPVQSAQGHVRKAMAKGELTLDDLIVDPARSLLLVAALIKTEVLLRTRVTVGQAPQPGQQWCVDALAEGRLKVACELAVPVQELDCDHGVRDGIRCLLSLRHALLARRPRDGGTLLFDQGLHRALVEAARGLLQLAARHREHRPRRTPRCREGQSARSYTAAEGD